MSGYFYVLLIASVCGAVCTVMVWGGFERYIKYIASLICVALLISPFRDLNIEQELDSYESLAAENHVSQAGLYELAAEMTEERAEDYISQIVFSEFGIKTVATDIKIDWEENEPIIEYISVTLASADMDMSEEAKDYLQRVLGGEVNVVEG